MRRLTWGPVQNVTPWLRGLAIVVAISVLLYAFRDVAARDVVEILKRVHPLGLLLALLPALAALGAETTGWGLCLRLNGYPLKLRSLLGVRIATEAVAQSLPGGAAWCESLKVLLLQRRFGIAMPEGVVAAAARRYLLLVSQGIFLAIVFVAAMRSLTAVSMRLSGTMWLAATPLVAGVAVLVASLGLVMALTQGRPVTRIFRTLAGAPVAALRRFAHAHEHAFMTSEVCARAFFETHLRRTTLPAALFVLVWLIESGETYLFLRLLGVDLDFPAVMGMEAIVVLVRHVLFMLPLGLGAQDAGYVLFLGALGVPDAVNTGAAFSVTKRLKELVWIAVGYLLLARELHLPVVFPLKLEARTP